MPAALPALENLFFSRVPSGTNVLDVCCGSGHVTQELVHRGYRVTGVDVSPELIAIARRLLPSVEFIVQDIRELRLDRRCNAAISTFDSLNHILSLQELRTALTRVHDALVPGSLFVFDVNLEEAYFADMRQWHTTVREREVSMVSGHYDLSTALAHTDLIWFLKQPEGELWERRTAVVYERCYGEGEIVEALAHAGFSGVEMRPAHEAGVNAELGFGRVFFSAVA